MNSLPTNKWEFLGLMAILAVQLYSAWQNRQIISKQDGIHTQLNSMTDKRVQVAGQAGRAEGFIAGGAAERDQLAKVIAAQVAAEVAERLAQEHKPAIQVKPIGSG